MDEVIVTAARTAQTVDQTLASVSVITRDDIEQSQATSVPQLLELLPGVQVAGSGGPGSTTSLFIRGTSSAQSLVMIDGQRLGSATNGSSSLQYLDPDQIERIEVVRGPKASLYGADAIGGVVNIITRRGRGEPHASVKAGYGSDNTRTGSVNIGGANETTNYHIGVSRFTTDGYDRKYHTQPTDDYDDDFYTNTTASAKLDHNFTDSLCVGFTLFHTEGTTKYDGYSGAAANSRNRFKNQLFSIYGEYAINDIWTTRLTLARTFDGYESIERNAATKSPFNTTRNLISWQNDIAITGNTLLTAGVDYYKDKIDVDKDYTETTRENKAVFGQILTTFDSSDLQISTRHDRNQYYGNRSTGNIAYGYNLPADMRLIGSYGTAFRAPTFNDLFWPGAGVPDLKPEKSKNAELELRGTYSLGQWSIAAFQNDIKEMISGWPPQNVNKARIRGVELSTSAQLADWRLKANLTLLDPKDRETDMVLDNRARQLLNLDVSKTIGKFTLGGSMHAQGHSIDGGKRLAGFATFNVRGTWQATREIKAELKATNLLDKEYVTVDSYREPGRGIFASITWTPEL